VNRLPPPGWDDKYRHVMPQYDMLHDADGRLLVDFVGRFESLQEDFRRVCAKLGIESAELPHRNRSDKKSRETRRKLRNWLYSNGENRLGLTRGVAWADNQRTITLETSHAIGHEPHGGGPLWWCRAPTSNLREEVYHETTRIAGPGRGHFYCRLPPCPPT
jgi:hypothetical protein